MSASLDALSKSLFQKIKLGRSPQEIATVLNQGVDVDALDLNYHSLLDEAASWSRNDIAELLVMRGAKIDHGRDFPRFNRDSPLLAAVSQNNTELVSFLLRHKAQINVRNDVRNTPLHIAALQSHAEIAKLLLENKADYTLKNYGSQTPMQVYRITDGMRQLILDQVEKDKMLDKDKDKDKDKDSVSEISKPKT